MVGTHVFHNFTSNCIFGLAKLTIDFHLTNFIKLFLTKSKFKLKWLIFENSHIKKVKQQI